MNSTHVRPGVEVLVRLHGGVSPEVAQYACEKLGPVVEQLHRPVSQVRVKLTQDPHPSVARPARAEATVDLNGRPVRAQVTAASLPEAVDLLKDRLTARLTRLSDRRAGHGHRLVGRRAALGGRPVEERQIVRRKSFPLPPQSVADALEEMEAMDHDFYLFKETVTGADCLLSHADPGGYRIERTVRATTPEVPATVLESPTPAPELTLAQAVERLELAALPFVFFLDPATERGSVLYHRHDGNYGVIRPGW